MRMQIVSDLHLEFGNPVPGLAAGVDVVVLAGDLAEIRHPWLLAEAVQVWEGAEHILYVPSNHEYYGSDIDEGRQILAGQCRIHGVTLLDPGAVTIAGVRFIGATLWTDFRLDGIANEPGAHAEAQRRISDFNGAIRQREGTRRFTTFELVWRHEAERAFIERELTAATETGTSAATAECRAVEGDYGLHDGQSRSVVQFRRCPRHGAFAIVSDRPILRLPSSNKVPARSRVECVA